jgi:mono/diheme cytochrome c family protein
MHRYPMCAAVVAGLIAAPLAAQSAVVPSQVTPAAVDAGRKIFHADGNCFQCHGGNLEGGPIAPALATGTFKDAKDGTFDAIVGVVTNGVPGTAMVSHPGGISGDQVKQVAAYVWAVSHKKAKP